MGKVPTPFRESETGFDWWSKKGGRGESGVVSLEPCDRQRKAPMARVVRGYEVANRMLVSRITGNGFGASRYVIRGVQATVHRIRQVAVCAVNAVGVADSVCPQGKRNAWSSQP